MMVNQNTHEILKTVIACNYTFEEMCYIGGLLVEKNGERKIFLIKLETAKEVPIHQVADKILSLIESIKNIFKDKIFVDKLIINENFILFEILEPTCSNIEQVDLDEKDKIKSKPLEDLISSLLKTKQVVFDESIQLDEKQKDDIKFKTFKLLALGLYKELDANYSFENYTENLREVINNLETRANWENTW